LQPHEVLGVRAGSSRREVVAAFRRYAQRHHPDHGGDRSRFQAGMDAYRRLTTGRPGGRASPERADVVFHRSSRSRIPSLLRRARRRMSASRQR